MAEFYTIPEAANQLKCSVRHVRRMIAAGKLRLLDIGLGKQQILRVELPEPRALSNKKPRRYKNYVPEILTDE